MFQKLIARQLANPSGVIGRLLTAPWLNKANARMNQLTLEQLSVSAHDRILEVGFGGGDLLRQILHAGPPAFLAGVDISPEMVVRAQRQLTRLSKERLEVRRGTIENIPFDSEHFTKLCTVNTIYFWQDPLAALTEGRRVLQTGGQIVICFNSREDLAAWPIHKHGFRLYEVAEVETLLTAAGFDHLEVVSAGDKVQGVFYCVKGMAV